jgi:hypothetical protein
MKKISKYILITIIIIQSFFIFREAQAQVTPIPNTPPLGWCVFPTGFGKTATVSEIGKDRCVKPATEGGRGGNWYATDPKIPTGTPLPTTPGTPFITPPVKNYVLLAPIPCDPQDDGCDPSGELKEYDPSTSTNAIGSYLNLMIKIFIGLCAVLAMIMIVVGGLEYMTSELISSKESGKQKITGAILGLLLALGSWAILNTINPELLNTEAKSLTQAVVEVQLEGESLSDAVTSEGGTPPTTPTALCQSGIKQTKSGMFACGNIAQNLDNMIDEAKKAGLNISGGGYRTNDQQTRLRIKNCAGNTTDRNAKCTPPTAIPGASRHNNGLAFDLKCDGITIQNTGNNCFVWLKENASRFGLYNLSGEAWHWSVDGR